MGNTRRAYYDMCDTVAAARKNMDAAHAEFDAATEERKAELWEAMEETEREYYLAKNHMEKLRARLG